MLREAGEKEAMGKIWQGMGASHEALGNYATALDCYRLHFEQVHALKQVQEQVHVAAILPCAGFDLTKSVILDGQCVFFQGLASSNMARVLFFKGDFQHAMETYMASLAAAREADDCEGEADALCNLGLCCRAACRFSQALDWHSVSCTSVSTDTASTSHTTAYPFTSTYTAARCSA
jgi:tetratricopeptide (TPR) repeat protein